MESGSIKGEQWTADRVCEAMVEAFRALPTMPVYSPRKAEFLPVVPGHDPSPLDVLALSEKVLGRSSPERRAVLVWARAKATSGDVGGSVRAYCAETGTNRRTFDRRRMQACARVAGEMNRIGDTTAAALEALRRTAPGIASRVDRL